MPKFTKGVYYFSIDEMNEIIENYKSGNVQIVKNKTYIPLFTKMNDTAIDIELFEKSLTKTTTKKELYYILDTTWFKLNKFCDKHYGTNDLATIYDQIQNRNSN